MYFLQSVGQIQVAAAFSASSGFHMVLGILMSGQYDVLFCSLKNIIATVSINRNLTKRDLRWVCLLFYIFFILFLTFSLSVVQGSF